MIWKTKQPDWAISQDFAWDLIDRETAIKELMANGKSYDVASARVRKWDHEKKNGPTPLERIAHVRAR